MSACTFFGHRFCYELDEDALRIEIESLIREGVDVFYVGNQGELDRCAYSVLRKLKRKYPYISVNVVLAYLPGKAKDDEFLGDTIYPNGLEYVHPRFAIDRRNLWMLNNSEYVVCYIRHSWGGAQRYVQKARRQGKCIIAL